MTEVNDVKGSRVVYADVRWT